MHLDDAVVEPSTWNSLSLDVLHVVLAKDCLFALSTNTLELFVSTFLCFSLSMFAFFHLSIFPSVYVSMGWGGG